MVDIVADVNDIAVDFIDIAADVMDMLADVKRREQPMTMGNLLRYCKSVDLNPVQGCKFRSSGRSRAVDCAIFRIVSGSVEEYRYRKDCIREESK